MIRKLACLLVGIVLVLAVAALAGCGTTRVVTRTDTVEVPKYIRAPLSPELLREHTYERPAPACRLADGSPTYCNGQLLDMLLDAAAALEREHLDKRAIRAAQESKP